MPREGFSVEYFCYENLGYSSKYVDELFDVLEECSKMVRYYLDTSAGFSDEIRSDINKLSMAVDNLYLDFETVYMMLAKLINTAKKEFFQSKKIEADKRLAKTISQRISKLETDMQEIIERVRTHMKKVHNFMATSGM